MSNKIESNNKMADIKAGINQYAPSSIMPAVPQRPGAGGNVNENLNLFESEQKQLSKWIEDSLLEVNKYPVLCKDFFKLLRLSDIARGYLELTQTLYGSDTVVTEFNDGNEHEYKVIRNPSCSKKKSTRHQSPTKYTYLNLDGVAVFCHHIYTRKLFTERVYLRAMKIIEYIRSIRTNTSGMLDTVRQVRVLAGIGAEPKQYEIGMITAVALMEIAEHQFAAPQRVIQILDKLEQRLKDNPKNLTEKEIISELVKG